MTLPWGALTEVADLFVPNIPHRLPLASPTGLREKMFLPHNFLLCVYVILSLLRCISVFVELAKAQESDVQHKRVMYKNP